MNLKKFVEIFISKIKGRPFRFDINITSYDLLNIVTSKLIELIRGIVSFRKVVFIGNNVTIFGKRSIHLGKGAVIGSFSELSGISREGLHIKEGSTIGRHSIIKVSGSLSDIGKCIYIDSNVGIGDFAHIGGAGGVFIGSNTIAGAYLSIHPENHIFSDTKTLIKNQGVNRKGISIGKNCWIGAKVTILDGSKIGSGSVIAAGAVVSGVFPPSVVIGGVPAKILKEITNEK